MKWFYETLPKIIFCKAVYVFTLIMITPEMPPSYYIVGWIIVILDLLIWGLFLINDLYVLITGNNHGIFLRPIIRRSETNGKKAGMDG